MDVGIYVLLLVINISVLAWSSVAEAAEKVSDDLDSSLLKMQQDFSVFKDLSQIKLDSTKEIVQKDIQLLVVRIDAQDKAIASLSDSIGKGVGLLDTALTILGVVLALAGIGSYISFKQQAREEAQEAASRWFSENSASLKSEVAALRSRLQEMEEHAKLRMESHVQEVENRADTAKKQIQENINSSERSNLSIDPTAATALAEMAEAAGEKSEDSASFKDWDTRAYNAYRLGKVTDAIDFWRKAVKCSDATPQAVAAALFNIGVLLDESDDSGSAVDTWMEVIERFRDDRSIQVRVQVAKSMLNIGSAFVLGGEWAKARDQYLDLVEKEQNTAHGEIKIEVARAKNGLGFLLLLEAKGRWMSSVKQDGLLHMAREYFEDSYSVEPDNYVVLANMAYCDHLLGEDSQLVLDNLQKSLKIGYKQAYDAVVGDLEIHSVPEKDAEFRKILETEWSIINSIS